MAGEDCITREYLDQIFVALKEQISELAEKLDEVTTKAASRKSGGGGKRKPSKYNLFVKVCMKGTGKLMKTCAAEYKAAKDDGTLDAVISGAEASE